MTTATPLPPDEARRLRLLAEMQVLDTPPEVGFDALAHAARLATGWPIALIALMDAGRQWFKARDGLDLCEVPRDAGLCAQALRGSGLFEVRDARADTGWAQSALVAEAPFARGYAAQPLVVQGVRMGMLCVIHTEPASLDTAQKALLPALAAAAGALLVERLNRARLELERQRFADFGAASGDWQWETDELHRVVWLSGGYESAMGMPPSALLGQALPDAPLVDTRGQALQRGLTLHALLARHLAFNRAAICMTVPPGERWLSLSAVPVLPRPASACGMRGTARDITERILAERARDVEARRLRRLVALVPGALCQFRVDTSGHASIPFASAGLDSLIGVTPAAVRTDAEPFFACIRADDRPRVERSLEDSLATMSAWQVSFRVRTPRGIERQLSAHATPQREPDGSVLWHGLMTDVSAQVQQRVERERLQRERDGARRDADARATALSQVSHELRTPLNAILGFTQLMQLSLHDNPPSAPTTGGNWAQWVQLVHHAASHLLALVNDVLDVSSLEARRFVADLQPVDAMEVAQQVVDMVRPQMHARQQSLELRAAAGNAAAGSRCWVLADKRGLRQVLINLLGNACKYTQRGGHVMLRWSVVDGRALELDVCDDGPGIQPAMREQLFQPFERGAASGGATAGTGLGLSISRQLVRAMHGELTLLPGTGQGAVFRIRLPLAPQSEQTVQPMPPNSSLFGALPTEPGSVTELLPDRLLLYVEDDPVNALLMSEFIARSPALRLHVAVDLDSGVAAANALQPALVLTDMHLPDGSGHDLLRLLRTSAATAGLRIVALSADAMPDQIQAALDAGFDAYWTKPVDFSLLRTRLMALLGS